MPHLDAVQWAVVVVAALFAGFSKTAIGGAGPVAAALFALVLPARESTGVLLPLLICGDMVAVSVYRRNANWRLVGRLMPWVLAGIAAGVLFVAKVRDDHAMRISIGVMILIVLATQFAIGGRLRERLTPTGAAATPAQHLAAGIAGIGVGFATMVANAAGSIMTVYLLLSGVTMLEFLGTGAWFFLIVNLTKLPFSGKLGLVQPSSLALDLALVPALALGAALGVILIKRIRQQQFEQAALWMAGLSAAFLLI
ncbi:MAG TPA: sulfite exporter TauE/SafE family protein [Kineosporiaceae bacterium]|nr:sulfite exporter TauE/SafE family protein [Kineosporiaceae bacterium]